MKTDADGKTNRRAVKDLGFRLTAAFIIFALLLIAFLWIFQSVFLDRYYELAMSNRCSRAVDSIASYYLKGGSYEEFIDFLGQKSADNDIYVYIESTDGLFYMSSSDSQKNPGRVVIGAFGLIDQARRSLQEGRRTVSFTQRERIGNLKDYVYAKSVSGENRNPVYIYAIATLSPLGPAVGIIRSQLLIITIIAFVIGIFIARFTAKRLARPLANMEVKAKELAKGNYDVEFEGGEYKELVDLADTLNQTAKDLKASDALQKDLIANVSHDLRTPLTMIKSYAELIRDISGDNPQKREEHLEVIIAETNRLDELVGDILTLSKMQAGVVEMEKTDFDLQEAAESVFNTYKVMENEGFTFHFNKAEGPVIVHADRHRIQQVIANMLSNAVRYSRDVKDVTLSFSVEGGKVRCAVSDKGIGIEEGDLQKIWNRYQKASKQGTRSSQGSGLGLSIASEVLEQHGSEYGVDSKPGEGSCFWFTLDVIK